MSLLIVCGQLDVRALLPHALPGRPNHGLESHQQSVSKLVKDSRADWIKDGDRLCFGLLSQVRFLFRVTAVLSSHLHIHDAPSRALHLKWRLRVLAGPLPIPSRVHQPQPRWRQVQGACEMSDRVTTCSYRSRWRRPAINSALDVLLEPCECLGGVWLCPSTKMRSLNISSSQRCEQASWILTPLPLTLGASMRAMRM
jgi:hypothetical protein